MSDLIIQAFLRIVASAICGSVIGLERELRQKWAGLKTHTAVSLGATIYTLASLLLPGKSLDKTFNDPSRIAAQVVLASSFLAGSVILRNQDTSQGVTTASTIWVTALMGMVIGFGQIELGAMIMVTTIFLMASISWIEAKYIRKMIEFHCEFEIIPFVSDYRTFFSESLIRHRLRQKSIHFHKSEGRLMVAIRFRGSIQSKNKLLKDLSHIRWLRLLTTR